MSLVAQVARQPVRPLCFSIDGCNPVSEVVCAAVPTGWCGPQRSEDTGKAG